MSARLRRIATGVCAAAALAMSGATAGLTTSPAQAEVRAGSGLPPGGVPGVTVPRVAWRDAGDGFQQADVTVPLDYARPRGRTLTLHLVRLPATDRAQRIGSLFVNFGGPGAPAASVIRLVGRELLPPTVTKRYDLVGVDPRGTGRSTPVRCFADSEEQAQHPVFLGETFPANAAEEAAAIKDVREVARECRRRNGDLLDHVGTLPAARDFDLLRAALGEARINLLGISYGTFLGQVIANVFPDRTGAMVLDSVVDPDWIDGPSGTPSWSRENGDKGSWQTLKQFFVLCDEAGPQRCAFAAGGNSRRKFAALASRLRREPLLVPLPAGPPVPLGYPDLVSFLVSTVGLYSPADWPLLAAVLQATYVRDGRAILEILSQFSGPPSPEYDGSPDAQAAIACSETDNPRDPRRYGRVGRQRDAIAPYVGSRWAYLALPCFAWRGHASERYTGPWTARTDRPVLLVNNRYDPATPFQNAQKVHGLLPGSALLRIDGVGHGGIFGSSCAMLLAARYLVTTTLPRDGTVCPQDAKPFAGFGDVAVAGGAAASSTRLVAGPTRFRLPALD